MKICKNIIIIHLWFKVLFKIIAQNQKILKGHRTLSNPIENISSN